MVFILHLVCVIVVETLRCAPVGRHIAREAFWDGEPVRTQTAAMCIHIYGCLPVACIVCRMQGVGSHPKLDRRLSDTCDCEAWQCLVS